MVAKHEPVRFIGGTASPYTQKMLALLRYRHIRAEVIWGQPEAVCRDLGIDPPRPALMPTFLFPEADGTLRAVTDTTPVIRRLETAHAGRSVIPDDPALAFLDYLIEDFADEWVTKYMFHYRWHGTQDADNAAHLLPLGFNVSLPDAALADLAANFKDRQVNRLYVVGSNPETAPLIEASFRRFLAAMEAHLGQQGFLFGRRPSAADFGLFGQMTQLVGFDPTPRAIVHEVSPRSVAWVDCMRDLSGLPADDSDWVDLRDQPDSLDALLAEIGRVYVPAQLANAAAVAAGEKQWSCEIDGAVWSQPSFPYQAKCLAWTRAAYDALADADRDRLESRLKNAGIDGFLVEEQK